VVAGIGSASDLAFRRERAGAAAAACVDADTADAVTGGISRAAPRAGPWLADVSPVGRSWPGARPGDAFLVEVRPDGTEGAPVGTAGPEGAPVGAGGPASGRGRDCAARAAGFPRRLPFLFLFVGGIVFLPGWHHIVAVQTGRMLDGLLRADDVSMKTTG
jgi:hypothetical protein